jgi:hypothetical protein
MTTEDDVLFAHLLGGFLRIIVLKLRNRVSCYFAFDGYFECFASRRLHIILTCQDCKDRLRSHKITLRWFKEEVVLAYVGGRIRSRLIHSTGRWTVVENHAQ